MIFSTIQEKLNTTAFLCQIVLRMSPKNGIPAKPFED